jgi:DNA helicase II / ATP-dependent DNA helicase PcrA
VNSAQVFSSPNLNLLFPKSQISNPQSPFLFPNGRILEADDQDMLEEERRLFYVALTRAKDELYLTYPMMNPKSYSGDVICRPSQFLEDFPQDLVEEWNVGNEDPWSDDEPF